MKFGGFIQFIKFAIIGVMNTLVDWVIFYALIYFFIPNQPLTAKAISFTVAAINSFIFNSIWTFRSEFYAGIADQSLKKIKIFDYFVRFFVVSVVGFAVNYVTFGFVLSRLAIASGILGAHANLFSLVCASAAAIVWNFFVNKFWTYKPTGRENLSEEQRKTLITHFKYNLVACGLLLIMATLSFFVMRGDSAIVDEIAHIPAGYSYIAYQDYRMNPEHPPLVKALAGVPLQFLNLNGPKFDSSWYSISQWDSGWFFLYHAGNDPDQILFLARLPMIGIMILLGALLYIWAVELLGHKTALFVLFLYAFTPDFIAHGHFVTTDVAAALGFVLGIYAFWKYVKRRSKSALIWAGIGLGIANLLKFSSVLLFAILLIYLFVLAYFDFKAAQNSYGRALWRWFKSYFWICVSALITIWLVYIPFVWNTPANIEKQLILNNLTSDSRTLVLRDFLDHFANNPFARALGHYLLGVMLVFGRVAGGNSTFILGHYSEKAIFWFFPVAYLVKTPLMILILAFFSIVYIFIRKIKNRDEAWFLWLVGIPFVVYWAVALRSSLDLGTRYLLPTIPFLYLFIGFCLKWLIESKKRLMLAVLAAIVLFLAVPVFAAYPYYLGYTNDLVLGKPGYQVVTDSAMDWGQDLKRFKTYLVDNNIPENQIKIDYFGGGLVSYYLPQAEVWRSGYGPTTGYLAVSATFYQMSMLQGRDGGKWSYAWLNNYKPQAIIGTSILLFHITPQDLANNPPKSPYAITHYDSPAADNIAVTPSNLISYPPISPYLLNK